MNWYTLKTNINNNVFVLRHIKLGRIQNITVRLDRNTKNGKPEFILTLTDGEYIYVTQQDYEDIVILLEIPKEK
jgi:hypothetical protein